MATATVALVGPRAAGKSTVGVLLARELGFTFWDADGELAAHVGCTAGAYLAAAGEAAFRRQEVEVSLALLLQQGAVVALGGGAVVSAELRARLVESEVYAALLLAPVPVLVDRLRHAAPLRPPLTNLPLAEEVAQLLTRRLPLYREVARTEHDTGSESPAAVARALAVLVRAAFAD